MSNKIDEDTFKRFSVRLNNTKQSLEERIDECRKKVAAIDHEVFDLETIEKRLDTFVDFSGCKVCDEMLDLFVERIIYRANDEFVWVMNLSGNRSDTRKYRIMEYCKEYSEELQSDETFDIVDQFMISL